MGILPRIIAVGAWRGPKPRLFRRIRRGGSRWIVMGKRDYAGDSGETRTEVILARSGSGPGDISEESMLITGKCGIRDRFWVGNEEVPIGDSLAHARFSEDGFSWGYGDGGPAQLAFAILLRVCGTEDAKAHFQRFRWDHVRHWSSGSDWRILVGEVKDWIREVKNDCGGYAE